MNQLTGLRLLRAAWTLAGVQMRQQFRRSRIGAAWIPLNIFFHVLVVGTIFRHVIAGGSDHYLVYFCVGYTSWWWFINTLSDWGNVWQQSERYVKHSNTGLPVVLWRALFRSVQTLAWVYPVMFAFLLVYGPPSPLAVLAWLPGVLLLVAFVTVLGTTWSLLCARFGDLSRLQPNLFLFAYLCTPIIWERDRLGENAWLADLNPLYHVIEVVREPLLGGQATLLNWTVALATLAFFTLVALVAWRLFRDRLVFWL